VKFTFAMPGFTSFWIQVTTANHQFAQAIAGDKPGTVGSGVFFLRLQGFPLTS
jgi:hypothetical protein